MKEGFWTSDHSNIMIIFPKKRGEGYLRQPVGHHQNKLSQFIDDEVKFKGRNITTYCGLDGYLSMEIKYTWFDEYPLIEKEVITPIAEFWQCKFTYMKHGDFLDLALSNLKQSQPPKSN